MAPMAGTGSAMTENSSCHILLAPRHECRDWVEGGITAEKRRMPLARDLEHRQVRPPRAHYSHGLARQQIRVLAADHHERHTGQCVELGPEGGRRFRRVDV